MPPDSSGLQRGASLVSVHRCPEFETDQGKISSLGPLLRQIDSELRIWYIVSLLRATSTKNRLRLTVFKS